MTRRLVIGDIEVEVRRNSRRRTRMGLAFDPGGFVIMDVPPDASSDEIRAVVGEHQRWLEVQLAKVRETADDVRPMRYRGGELVLYLGDPYLLEVRRGEGERVVVSAARQLGLFDSGWGELRVTAADKSVARVKNLLDDWFIGRADELFRERLRQFVELPWLGGELPPWRQSFMRSQWGSCSSTGRISLNTHLVKAPVKLTDYVILHELCHLKHHNHGRRFYSLLARHMPDWERRRAGLNRYLPLLLQD